MKTINNPKNQSTDFENHTMEQMLMLGRVERSQALYRGLSNIKRLFQTKTTNARQTQLDKAALTE